MANADADVRKGEIENLNNSAKQLYINTGKQSFSASAGANCNDK